VGHKTKTKEGLVRTERAIQGGRTVLKVRAVAWQEFFTPEELEEFQNLEL
jgi:hypothetical protein